MSTKRTSSESNNDLKTDEGSESPIQREGDAKHVKLDPQSDTTLQDLPVELLECILVKTVVMEVKDLKLAKSVWKEKTDLVIGRLRPVCSLWSDILTTNSFRTKLHRTIDRTAQTVRLEILRESLIHSQTEATTTLKDEVFLLYRQRDGHYVIKVYNRDNMEEVKEVIPLPGTDPRHMTGCNISNCLYINLRQGDSYDREILRISKDADHKFRLSPWINDHNVISVTPSGGIILYSMRGGEDPAVVRICNADGSLQHEIMLAKDIFAFSCWNVIQKSNGNLVLVRLCKDRPNKCITLGLVEIDTCGSLVRQFQSSVKRSEESFVRVADENDRMIVGNAFEEIQLLDSEFNLLGVYSLPKSEGKLRLINLHYDFNRNEIVRLHSDWSVNVLTIFRFTEE